MTDLSKKTILDRSGQILLLLYLLATLGLVFVHEPWEDELQAWCIARELSVPEIFYQMRYEGHFALWYLLLKPLTWAGASVSLMNLVSWLLCAMAAGFLAGSRRFGTITKVLIL